MRLRISMLFVLGSVVALPLAAEKPAALPPAFSELISLDLVEAKSSEVFQLLAQITDARFELVPVFDKPVTVRLQGVRVRLALDVLCESLGCRWQYFGPAPDDRVEVVMRRDVGPPGTDSPKNLDQVIDLSLKEADAKAVLASFAQILQAEVALDGSITGRLTLEIDSKPARTVLDEICARLGCRWELLDGPVVTLRVVKQ